MTVAEMLERISSVELTRWMIYFNLEPSAVMVNRWGHATTAATIANVNRKKGAKPYDVEGFMPEFGKSKGQSTSEMIGVASMLTIASGGEDKR
jgi:hypothetical protein